MSNENVVINEIELCCKRIQEFNIKPSVECRRQFLDQVLLIMGSTEYVFVTSTSLRERP